MGTQPTGNRLQKQSSNIELHRVRPTGSDEDQIVRKNERLNRVLFVAVTITFSIVVAAESVRILFPDHDSLRDLLLFTAAAIFSVSAVRVLRRLLAARLLVWVATIAASFLLLSQGLNVADEIPLLDGVAIVGNMGVFHAILKDLFGSAGLLLFVATFLMTSAELSRTSARLDVEKRDLATQIADGRQTEEALRDSEQRYRMIAENVSDIVWTVDMDMNLTFVSPSVERVLGFSPEDFRRLGLRDILTQDSFEKVRQDFEGRLSTDTERAGQPYHPTAKEYEFVRKNGSKVVCEITSLFLRDSEMNPIGVIGVARDVTDRKRAEQAMIQASRLEATATLAGGVAHDFNNLMTAVLGNAELLQAEFENREDVRHMLDVIADGAKSAASLTQQLLAYARSGKYESRVLDLNDTVREVLRAETRKVSPDVRIDCTLEEDLWGIEGDPTQIGQVLLSLITNSVESTEGSGRIHISTENIHVDGGGPDGHSFVQPGPYVRVSVEDTGCGMDRETLSRVFEPFFSTKFAGRGLGLSAAYGIVKNHEGYIVVSSHPSEGATFSVYFPMTHAAPEARRVLAPGPPPQGETILVAEDEEMVLEMTDAMLRSLGYQPILARNGQEAVRIAETFDGPIHLAWIDLEMPVMDGVTAIPLLRKQRPDMRIILCSGYDRETAAQSMDDSEGYSFIQKPFTRDAVLDAVQMALQD